MKRMFITLMMLATTVVSYSQDGKELLFESNKMVWCGLDYSNVKCIGPEGFNEPDQVKEKYFDGWNKLMRDEASKYNFKDAYDMEVMERSLDVVEQRNDMPEIDELVIDEPYAFEEGQLKSIVNAYDLEDHNEGLGLVYVVETLNKTEQEASIYVVFFDISSKEILWSKRYVTSAAGFGFRNYWARPVYNTMRESEDDFKAERKQYLKEKKKRK